MLPPAHPSPRLVQTIRILNEPYPFVDECKTRFGEIFRVQLLGTPDLVLLSAPDHLKEMFTAPADVLHAGEANRVVFGPIAGHHTLFTLDEGRHARQRKLLQPPLHGERMQVYADTMRSITEARIAAWPKDHAFPLHREMQEIALQVILRAIFGLEHGARAEALRRAMSALADIGLASPLLLVPALQWDLGRFSPWGRVMRVRREAVRALEVEIADRRALGGRLDARDDVLSLLLSAKGEDGLSLGDEELRDELITLLLAGHETTATSLAWVFERVLSLPAVLERVVAEIDAVAGASPILREHLPRLEYTEAVIKEAIRLRPISVIAATRVVKRDFEIGGFVLPPGIRVASCHYLAHRRAETYADPAEFRPERFLGKKAEPFEWVPFGGGVRRCIGAAFASFEMKIVVATVLKAVVLRLPRPCRSVRRGVFTAPEGGLPVEIAGLRGGT